MGGKYIVCNKDTGEEVDCTTMIDARKILCELLILGYTAYIFTIKMWQ
jgi:hypothetical protein